MNVEAAAKGLVRGPLTIQLRTGQTVSCIAQDHIISRPDDYTGLSIGRCTAILVIEKEAVFRSLCNYVSTDSVKFLLVTGKGCMQ